jgi:hypothetical protein
VVIAVISDTHLPRGRRSLPDACVARLRSADQIIHAGDFSAVDVLVGLEKLGPPVVAVHGNADDAPLRDRLPARCEIELDGVGIGLVHNAGPAAGRIGRLQARFPRAAVVVFGHSHTPLLERGLDGFQIFNPGSPTDRRKAPEHTMGIMRLEGGAVECELLGLGA